MKKPLIMGVLNLTPDSFSDGGKFNKIEKAIKRVKEMEKEGVDIIDIGAESSGPNSKKISLEEEKKRLLSILKKIRKTTKLPLSIDTYKSQIAEIAIEEGANIINDVTALRGDKNMAKVISKSNAKLILMYSKDPTVRTTIKKKQYKDVIKTISDFFKNRIAYAEKEKIKSSQIIIDPGMGHFISSIPKYSYEIISRLSELKKIKQPILLGISRKSFLGGDLKSRDQRGIPLSAIAYLNGASIIRTHNIKATKEFFKKINQ